MTVDVLGIPADIFDELARRLEKKAGSRRTASRSPRRTRTPARCSRARTPTLFGVPIPKEHQANIDKYTPEFLDKLEAVGARGAQGPEAGEAGVGRRQGDVRDEPPHEGRADRSRPAGAVRQGREGQGAGGLLDLRLPLRHAVAQQDRRRLGRLRGRGDRGHVPGRGRPRLDRLRGGPEPELRRHRRQGRGRRCPGPRDRRRGEAALAATSSPRSPGRLTAKVKTLELPLAELPTRAQWEEKAKRMDAIGHHARVTLAKLDKGEKLPTKIDLPGPDLGVRRLAGDGLPARRSRRRLLAAAEEGTRRPAAVGHRPTRTTPRATSRPSAS